MIEVRELRKCYGPLVAVDGISFALPAGETFGLLGPNGAGKTTTIHMMVGVLTPDGGRVLVDGGLDPRQAAARRRIGVAPQALALYPDLSGEENVAFFGRLYGLRGRRLAERVRAALDFAGLWDRRRDRVSAYSGGMQRRLNLAAALVHDPPVLFLDEPTAGVDPQSRNHIFDSIEALKREGRTILYTTHYMEEAQRLCDRVAIMDRGRILALDTVPRLIEAHGGRSLVRAELEQTPAEGASLPGRLEGRTLLIDTRHPMEEVARLASRGLAFATLQIERPNLETVFLELTGRSLRDS